jgi:predicted Zn-dependent peptidase
MISFKKKVLSNGLRVIAAPMENTDAVTLLVLAGVGSRYETKNINGISHFLEHLFFKGTKSRPKPGEVFKELDRIGSAYNAFTSKETTGFWVKSSAKDFDIGLDIVSDILQEPLFKKEEIEKERGVILQEINMYEDEPRRNVWNVLENVLYGDQPVGWDILGTKETVASIKRSDIINYRTKNYLSKNMIVVVAGNIDVKIVFKKIEKYFKRIKKGKNRLSKKTKIFQRPPRIKIINKDSDQTHLALGIRAYDMFHEKRYALNLLATILGGNFSSKLVMEIREKLGLAYYVYAFGDQYMDCGYLGIGTGIAHQELERVATKIIEILKRIKQKGFSKKDLDSAKSYLRGQMALKLETSDQVATFCAGQEIFYHKILQPEEVLKKLNKVSQNDILRVANEIFVPNKMNMAVIGSQDDFTKKELFYKNLLCKSLM